MSSGITKYRRSSWLTWLPLFRFFFVRIDRSSHMRNFTCFTFDIVAVALGLMAPSKEGPNPKLMGIDEINVELGSHQISKEFWRQLLSSSLCNMDHREIDFWWWSKLTLMLSKRPSRPPSMMIMPSPAFMEFVSASNRRDKADWKSLACLPSRRGGSLSEGWVAASPAVFESLSTWWGHQSMG